MKSNAKLGQLAYEGYLEKIKIHHISKIDGNDNIKI